MFDNVKSFVTNPSVRYRATLIVGSAAGILAAYSISAKISMARANAEIAELHLSEEDTSE